MRRPERSWASHHASHGSLLVCTVYKRRFRRWIDRIFWLAAHLSCSFRFLIARAKRVRGTPRAELSCSSCIARVAAITKEIMGHPVAGASESGPQLPFHVEVESTIKAFNSFHLIMFSALYHGPPGSNLSLSQLMHQLTFLPRATANIFDALGYGPYAFSSSKFNWRCIERCIRRMYIGRREEWGNFVKMASLKPLLVTYSLLIFCPCPAETCFACIVSTATTVICRSYVS